MNYYLPTSVDVNGNEYQIDTDYRTVLITLEALSDPELTDQDKAEVMLSNFFPDFPENMPTEDYAEAVNQCFSFINLGEAQKAVKSGPKLLDWQQDFPLIVSPINRVMGTEIRALEYLHWWTFIAAYNEIGDCTFSQVVNIRNKRATGKPLDKGEREFYRKNRELVDFQKKYTSEDDELISKWV